VVAFDISKADIDLLLKNSPSAVDQQMRGATGGPLTSMAERDRVP
jgi:hypothetical protein